MITLADVRPGDIIFGPIGGIVPGWFPVAVGQALLADRKARLTWKRWRKIRHVLVVTEAAQQWPPMSPGWTPDSWPKAVQAMPRGAEEIKLSDRHWTADYVYVRPAYQTADPTFALDMPGHPYAIGQAEMVAQAARSYIGTPYGFLTYGALSVEHVLPGRQTRLAAYISSRKEMICSQLADQAMSDAGFHVFDDGRLPQDVVPAELFRALIDRSGSQYVVPGMPAWAKAGDYLHRDWR